MQDSAEIIFKYFPNLSQRQRSQFAMLARIYNEWNARINLVSRRDIGFLYERHVLHSLAVAKCADFPPQSTILDIGTGGGFPGIPLAIMYPDAHFTLADSTGKKITAVQEIVKSLQLQNAAPLHIRAESIPQRFDFAVCRSVAPLPVLLAWVGTKINNAAFFLKGGDVSQEIKAAGRQMQVFEISTWFSEEFFATKKLLACNFLPTFDV